MLDLGGKLGYFFLTFDCSPRLCHRWMNEFPSMSTEEVPREEQLQVDDLVTMTIVDVFETDNNGKLLSYCPTFDNRRVQKTSPTNEAVRKSSAKIMGQISLISKSQAAVKVNQSISHVASLGMSAAKSMASSVHRSVNKQIEHMVSSPSREATPKSELVSAKEFELALDGEEAKMKMPSLSIPTDDGVAPTAAEEDDQNLEAQPPAVQTVGSSLYLSDDSTAQYSK